MSADVAALTASYVTQMQRIHARSTRGIATPEQRKVWEDEAHAIIRQVEAAALRDASDGLRTGNWPVAYEAGVRGAARELDYRADTIEKGDGR